mgnify:CR=1 FL=1
MGGVFAACAKEIAADVDVAVEVADGDYLRERRVLALAALRLLLFALVLTVRSSAISAPRAAAAAAITNGGFLQSFSEHVSND